jgi:hypothetical protein
MVEHMDGYPLRNAIESDINVGLSPKSVIETVGDGGRSTTNSGQVAAPQ